jgi:hypothetical protein
MIYRPRWQGGGGTLTLKGRQIKRMATHVYCCCPNAWVIITRAKVAARTPDSGLAIIFLQLHLILVAKKILKLKDFISLFLLYFVYLVLAGDLKMDE